MNTIKHIAIGMYETYNASFGATDAHCFVSHDGQEHLTRMSLVGHQFSACVYLTNEEAQAVAKMLTDAVNSHKCPEEA